MSHLPSRSISATPKSCVQPDGPKLTPFMRLPLELRLMVYEVIFYDNPNAINDYGTDYDSVYGHTKKHRIKLPISRRHSHNVRNVWWKIYPSIDGDNAGWAPPAIARASPQIRSEVLPLFFQKHDLVYHTMYSPTTLDRVLRRMRRFYPGVRLPFRFHVAYCHRPIMEPHNGFVHFLALFMSVVVTHREVFTSEQGVSWESVTRLPSGPSGDKNRPQINVIAACIDYAIMDRSLTPGVGKSVRLLVTKVNEIMARDHWNPHPQDASTKPIIPDRLELYSDALGPRHPDFS